MKNRKSIISVLVIGALFGALFTSFVGTVVAPIDMPYNVYGNATWGETVISAGPTGGGQNISGWIDGVCYGNITTMPTSEFDLYVEGDWWGDPLNDSRKDGGYDGDEVFFFINYNAMDYHFNICNITSPFAVGGVDNLDLFFDTNTSWEGMTSTNLRGLKINEIILYPSDIFPQYLILYDSGGELSEAALEDANSGYYLQKDDSTTHTPNGPIFDFNSHQNDVVALGGGFYYINLTALTLTDDDELKLVWNNPGGGDNIAGGSDVIVDRVEWGNFINQNATDQSWRDYDNTTMLDCIGLPLAGDSYRRKSDGFDTDNCANDFQIGAATPRPGPTPPTPEPIIGIQKAVSTGTAYPGDTIVYTIWHNNTGLGVSPTTWVNDTLDANLNFVSSTPAPTTSAPPFYSWEYTDVGPGNNFTTITVTINVGVSDGTIISDSADLDYFNTTYVLTHVTSNTVNTVVQSSDMTIDKLVDNTTVLPDDFITYTIWFNNTGSADAATVWINDTFDDVNSAYISSSSSDVIAFSDTSGNPLVFRFDNVAPGNHWLEIVVQVGSAVPDGTWINNIAQLEYTDPNDNNIPPAQITPQVQSQVVIGAAGPVVRIELTPWPSVTGTTDDSTIYRAVGYDAGGMINWSWTPDWSWLGTVLGPIVPLDPYNVSVDYDTVGSDWIHVEVLGDPSIFNETAVDISVGAVAYIELMPWPSVTGTTDDSDIYQAIGYDADDNENWIWTPDWSWLGTVLGPIVPLDPYNVSVDYDTVGSDWIHVEVSGDPSIFNETSVDISVGAPYMIEYISGNGQIEWANSVLPQPFEVRVTDADGNPISGVNITWTITNFPIGAVGQSLSWVTSQTDASGIANVTLTLGDLDGVYEVEATNDTLVLVGEPIVFTATASSWTIDYIMIIDEATGLPVPDGYIMSADEELKLIAYAYNSSGGVNLGPVAVNWSVVGGIGGLTNQTPNRQQQTTFDAMFVGTGNITAEFDNGTVLIANVTGNITVIVGAVAYIVLTPPSVTATTDDSDIFRAVGYDADGNENWTWTPAWSWASGGAGLGTITPIDLYNVTVDYDTPGADSVHVEVSGQPGIFDESTVDISVGAVFTIVLTPVSFTGTTDDSTIFRAVGYDADGNENWIWTPAWSWASGGAGLGTITPIDLYNVTVDYDTPGADSVHVEVSGQPGIFDESTVDISVGAVFTIVLTPASVTGTTDDSDIFRAVGYDADGNENWTWTPAWSWASGGAGLGTITPIDLYNVTVDYDTPGADSVHVEVSGQPGIFDESTVDISVGAVASIVLTPPSVANDVGNSDTFSAIGYDADGNENWTWASDWNWDGAGLIGTITPIDSYNVSVQWDVDGSDVLNVTVLGAPLIYDTSDITITAYIVLSKIELTPWPTQINNSDETMIFRAVGKNTDDSENWTWTPDWSWLGGGLGTIVPIDAYNVSVAYDTAGTDTIHVKLLGDSIFNETMVTVIAGAVASIDITPWPSATATTDDTGAFQAVGYDADGNVNWTWTPDWNWIGAGLGTIDDVTDIYNVTVPYDMVGSDDIIVNVTGTAISNQTAIGVSAGAPYEMQYVSGTGQMGPLNGTLVAPFVVLVLDADGWPVSGVEISWTIVDIPVGANWQSIPATSTTDANGEASALLKLGDMEGIYNVSATNATLVLVGEPVSFEGNATAITVDNIKIMTAAGGTGIEVTTGLQWQYGVYETDMFYCAGFSGTTYLWDVDALWSIDDDNVGDVTNKIVANLMTTFTAGWITDDADTCTVTATYNSYTDSTGLLTVFKPEPDYIVIVDTPDVGTTEVGDMEYIVYETDFFYAAAFNTTVDDYIYDVDATWVSDDEDVGEIEVPVAQPPTFTAGWVDITSTCNVTATYQGMTDTTGVLTVLAPTIDYIQIRTAAGGGGVVLATASFDVGDTDMYYCAGYNYTIDDYVKDVSADWAITGLIGTVTPTTGTSTEFNATTAGTGTITATYDSLTNSSGTITVTEAVEDLPPAKPGKPTLKVKGKDEIEIEWQANTEDDLAGYILYRATDPDNNATWIPFILGPSVTSYTDTGLKEGTKYYYSVIAYDDAGHSSEQSDWANAETEGKEEAFPWVLLLLPIIIAIIVILLLLFLWKKKKKEEEAPPEVAPPPEAPMEEEAPPPEMEEEMPEEEMMEEEPYEEAPSEEPYEEAPPEEPYEEAPPEEEPTGEPETPEEEERTTPPPPPPP